MPWRVACFAWGIMSTHPSSPQGVITASEQLRRTWATSQNNLAPLPSVYESHWQASWLVSPGPISKCRLPNDDTLRSGAVGPITIKTNQALKV